MRLVADAGATGDEPVPACPGWTVRDVVAHLVGLAESWLDGNLEVYASPDWTAGQVATWSDRDLDELADAWNALGDRLADQLDDLEAVARLPRVITTINGPAPLSTFATGIVVDALLHQGDVARALDVDDAANDFRAGLTTVLVRGAGIAWRRAGHEPVAVFSVDDGRLGQLGVDEPTRSVTGTTADLFRSFGGRRTLHQIGQLHWEPSAPLDLGDVVVRFFRPPPEAIETGPEPVS